MFSKLRKETVKEIRRREILIEQIRDGTSIGIKKTGTDLGENRNLQLANKET